MQRGNAEIEWKIDTHLSSSFWKIFSKKVLTQNTDDDKIVNVAERQQEKGTSHKWEVSECAKSRFGTPAYDLWKLNRGN